MKLDREGVRHVLMRLGLGFVLGWFGLQELRTPSEWAVFVPSFVSGLSPVGVDDLVLLHGFLLLVAASSLVLGLLFLPGCLLAAGLLAEITLGLWLEDGVNDLLVRDIGLLAAASALALDGVRMWRLDSAFARPEEPRASRRRSARDGRGAPGAYPWAPRAASALAVVGLVFGLGYILHVTGGGGSAASGDPTASVSGAAGPSPAASSPPPPAASPSPGAAAAAQGTPAPASSIRFDDWRYKPWSFQVYPGEPSAEAKKALAGFDLSVQDQGDTVLVLLKALDSRYRDSQTVVAKGNTAYFVETSMRDDPAGRENNLRDDAIIVVDGNGYILQQ